MHCIFRALEFLARAPTTYAGTSKTTRVIYFNRGEYLLTLIETLRENIGILAR